MFRGCLSRGAKSKKKNPQVKVQILSDNFTQLKLQVSGQKHIE